MMFRYSVLLGAVIVSAPTIWAALGTQTLPVTDALIHFVIAVPVVAVLFAFVRTYFDSRHTASSPRAKSVDAAKENMVD